MKRWHRKRQGGVAAVELAIIYVTMFAIIPFVFLFGRIFLQYNVLKHAAFDAAQYIASAGIAKLTSSTAMLKMNAHSLVEQAGKAAGQVQVLETILACNSPKKTCHDAETIRFTVVASVTDFGFFGILYPMFVDEFGDYVFEVAVEVPNASRLPSV